MNKIVLLMLLFALPLGATEYQVNQKIGALFQQAEVKGTFVVWDLHAASFDVYDLDRAKKRYVPASTFKIPHSLIGLSLGAVKDVDEVLPYGGKPQPFKAWEKDMGLREAIKISNVPIYQAMARRIGLKRMRNNVQKIQYGNGQIGDVVDRFWLDGPLAISAVEQTLFLARLAQGELPFPQAAQASVRDILKLEEGKGWVLYGKTGWSKKIGWWVGWVEKSGHLYAFALNMDMPDIKDAPKRVELGKKCLRTLGILK
jgi:beta-lactamase class D